MLSIFSCAHCPPVCRLWRNVYVGLLPIFQLVGCFLFSYMSCLYILEIKSLFVPSFINMLYHSLSCLFILFKCVCEPNTITFIYESPESYKYLIYIRASHVVLVVKNPPAKAMGSIPGSGRHGNPLQHSCWENPMDRGA